MLVVMQVRDPSLEARPHQFVSPSWVHRQPTSSGPLESREEEMQADAGLFYGVGL